MCLPTGGANAGGDAPFAGVPFLAKDLLGGYAGHPTTAGSRLLEGVVADVIVRHLFPEHRLGHQTGLHALLQHALFRVSHGLDLLRQ